MIYKVPNLETKRLFLKKANGKDMAKVYEYDFKYLRGYDGIYKKVKQSCDILSWYEDDEENVYDFGVYLKSGEVIANIFTYNVVDDVELSYNMHPDYWKHGYMIEAINEVIKFLFTVGYKEIIISYAQENSNSKGICEKLGFEYHSIIKDEHIFNGKSISLVKTVLSYEKYLEINKCNIK
ncbi:MAG: GNAT family N-acetyltransferase [Mycoplasmatota bacterium]